MTNTGEVVLRDFGTREAWLAGRRSGVGASESAALFGISPFTTMLELWGLKTGRLEPQDHDREYVSMGNRLEGVIADIYVELTGRKVWQGGPYCVAQHPTIEVMRATPDRWIIESPDRDAPGLLQIKNTGEYKANDWIDGPPDFVQVQVQHEMAVTGREWASVAVCIGGNRVRHFDVERNPTFIEELEEQVRYFWSFVESGQQPPLIAERDGGTVKRLHPSDSGAEIILPSEAEEWWAAIEAARARKSAAEKEIKGPETLLRDAIGDATFGILPDGRRLSLATQSREGYAVEPTTFRTLKLEKKGRSK